MNHRGSEIELRSPTPRGAVLIFHGLTSTPQEVANLATSLHERGFSVLAPLLSGHGISVDELRRTRTDLWLKDAENAFRRVRDMALPTVVVGASFGALLSWQIALQNQDMVRGVIALSPPVRLRRRVSHFSSILLSYFPEALLNCFGIVSKQERAAGELVIERCAFDEHSKGAIARLVKLRRAIFPGMKKLKVPVKLLQDPYDHLLSFEGALEFIGSLPNAVVEFDAVVGGQHELLLGPRHEEVIRLITQFVEKRVEK